MHAQHFFALNNRWDLVYFLGVNPTCNRLPRLIVENKFGGRGVINTDEGDYLGKSIGQIAFGKNTFVYANANFIAHSEIYHTTISPRNCVWHAPLITNPRPASTGVIPIGLYLYMLLYVFINSGKIDNQRVNASQWTTWTCSLTFSWISPRYTPSSCCT